jgi:L-amino acid N-acyltransferase YncA/uncharacterized damage-inducible protein DinB
MILTPIPQDGQLPDSFPLDDHLRMVVEMTVRHFEKVGSIPPWVGYVAVENSVAVGTCAFKAPPIDGRVEIAYGTMPGFEGQGIATAMARELVRIAQQEDEHLTVFAQTLPEQNASTSILKKLGFRLIGTVEHPEDGTVWEWELPPPATISIRHALASDAATIADIYNEAIRTTTATFDTEPKTADERLRWLEAHDERHPVLVAELDGQVVGWAALTTWSDRPAYEQTAETSSYVAEAFHGRGVGRALKQRLIEEARRLGFHTILARVAEESEASLHINESFGFKHIGTMKEVGLKFGRRLDVHVMQLMLNETADSGMVTPSQATDCLASVVIRSALDTFQANKQLADRAVEQVPDDKLHVALDEHTNSIAVIMKHVAGNLISRWTDFLTTDGEKPWRHRDNEFVDSFSSRTEVLEYWERGWNCLLETLQNLTPEDLEKTVTIRGEPHSVPLAIARSLGHTCYHVGQIVQVARILAADEWNTLTIPRGKSEEFNRAKWDQSEKADL